MDQLKFKATKVFQECYDAINETFVNEKGEKARRYRLIEQVGGSRSSKTFSDFQIIFLYGYQNYNKTITVMRDTAADCRDKVEPDFLNWLKDPNGRIKEFEKGLISGIELNKLLDKENLLKYLKRNKSEHSYTFENTGSVITFTGTDDENRSIGKSQNVLWINEPYVFSEEVFLQLTQRTSDFIIVDWNPKQNHFIEKQRLKNDTFSHRSTFADNPFCPPESKKQIQSYQPIAFSDVVLSGLILEPAAKIYNCEENPLNFTKKQVSELKRCQYNEKTDTASKYHWLVYGLGEKAEKPNKIYHGWKTITLEDYQKKTFQKFYGLDYGFANPTACVEIMYDGDRGFYVRPLLYKPMNLLGVPLGEALTAVGVPSGPVTYIWADSSDKEPGSDISLTNDLRSNYKLNAIPTKKPTYKARFDFIDKCKIFYVQDKDFESEYDNYEYEYINGFPTERPIKKNDHYMNAFEYCIMGVKDLLNIAF